MAKKARAGRPPKELTRKQLSRIEQERRLERALWIGIGIVAVLVVGVLGAGFLTENVLKAREAVARVSGIPIRTADFQARVRFNRMQLRQQIAQLHQQRQSIDTTKEGAEYLINYIDGQIAQLESRLSEANADTLGDEALDQLVLFQLACQEAERRGIVVTDEDVERQVELDFGYDRDAPGLSLTPSPLVTQTLPFTSTSVSEPTSTPMTEAEFREQYNRVVREILRPLKISERQLRDWVRGGLCVQKLYEAMAAELPANQEQVQLKLLVAQDEQKAQELVERLKAGESMDSLAEELEQAEQPPGYVTELNWLPRSLVEDRLGAELAELAFTLPIGAHSEVVSGPDGAYYVIQVLGREVRQLDDTTRDELANRLFEEWYKLQKETVVAYYEYRDRIPLEP